MAASTERATGATTAKAMVAEMAALMAEATAMATVATSGREEAAMATWKEVVATAMAAMEMQRVEDQTSAVTGGCSRCSPCMARRK